MNLYRPLIILINDYDLVYKFILFYWFTNETDYIYIYIQREREAGLYENANFLRERDELFRCTKSYMIHIQKSIYKNHVQNHI